MANTTQPDPWKIDAGDYPRRAPLADRLRFLVRYAVLAPSSHNTQPWRFRVADERIDLFMDESRWLRVADEDQRELHLSVGCALENLLISAAHFDLGCRVTYLPSPGDPPHAASVDFGASAQPPPTKLPVLFEMITVRHTNHQEYEPRAIPPAVLDQLRDCVDEPNVQLMLTDDAQIKQRVDELVVRSDAIEFADEAFRAELAYWIGQGVFGTSWLMSKIGKLAVTYLNIGQLQAKRDSSVLLSAPVLGLLASPNDRTSQIQAGQVYQRLGLLAASHGIWCQPMSQIVHVEETTQQLEKLIAIEGLKPVHPFRLGYAAAEKQHTPRRPVADVLE